MALDVEVWKIVRKIVAKVGKELGALIVCHRIEQWRNGSSGAILEGFHRIEGRAHVGNVGLVGNQPAGAHQVQNVAQVQTGNSRVRQAASPIKLVGFVFALDS